MGKKADNDGAFGALMTDHFEAFDCLYHGLLIAKPCTYGFDIKSVKLIQQYLSIRVKGGKDEVPGNKFFIVFHRNSYLVFLFSISFNVTYFISWKVS